MREFEKKRKVKKLIYGKITLILLLVIFIFVFHGTFKIFQKQQLVKENLKSTEHDLSYSNERKINLENKLDRIDSPVGKEELLRENYSLSKEGEKAFYVLDSEEEVEIEAKEKSLIKKIFSPLINLFN